MFQARIDHGSNRAYHILRYAGISVLRSHRGQKRTGQSFNGGCGFSRHRSVLQRGNKRYSGRVPENRRAPLFDRNSTELFNEHGIQTMQYVFSPGGCWAMRIRGVSWRKMHLWVGISFAFAYAVWLIIWYNPLLTRWTYATLRMACVVIGISAIITDICTRMLHKRKKHIFPVSVLLSFIVLFSIGVIWVYQDLLESASLLDAIRGSLFQIVVFGGVMLLISSTLLFRLLFTQQKSEENEHSAH